jgi:tol-pal system protein YbgF
MRVSAAIVLVVAVASTAFAVAPDVQADYDKAYALYCEGKYAEARDAFGVVLAKDPVGSFADNCQYWIGETHFSQKDYRAAVTAFRKVFTFADNNKEADSQLKLGHCFLSLGQREQAVVEFTLTTTLYPGSPAAERAAAELRRLGR